jgi:hypothetical protein
MLAFLGISAVRPAELRLRDTAPRSGREPAGRPPREGVGPRRGTRRPAVGAGETQR